MDVVTPHKFMIDLDTPEEMKPLPYTLGKSKSKSDRIKQIDYYPKFEVEFFDVVKSCAEYIDKLLDANERLEYTKRLNKIFVSRNKPNLMNLFRDLVIARVHEI